MPQSKPKVKETFAQQMKGFPWAQIFIICLVRFAEPIAFTSLFPYVFFMVRDFHIAPTDAEISKYSGYLSSTFAFCQFLTSYHWGRFADRHGRKPALVIGLTGSIISLLIFGFSKNYYQALFARSIMGLLNGNVAVLRTMIGEVTTERKHQALAFSTMPLFFQIGGVIGPMIGGYLSGSETSFTFLEPFVTTFPYAFPNVCIASLLLFSMTVAIFFLEESHWKYKYRRDYFVEVGDWIKCTLFGMKPKERPWKKDNIEQFTDQQETISPNEETALIDEGHHDAPAYLASSPSSSTATSTASTISTEPILLTRRESETLVRTYSRLTIEEEEEPVSLTALLPPHIFYALLCNFIMSLHGTVHNEFLPIFLAQDISRDPSTGKLDSHFPFDLKGGLSFNSQDTGRLLSLTGAMGIMVILFVFPYVDHNYESLPIYKTMVSIFPISYTITPYLVFAADSKPLAMTLAYMLTCTRTFATSLANPQITMIVHTSSPAKHRGMINGATISINALARCLGPLVWGYLFTWGEAWGKGWLGWWTLSLVTLMSVYQSRYLRESEQDPNDQTNQATESSENSETA